ncbi:hypothetical protein EC957_004308 [Mortierella hygrophila]|uniref:WKF domain-containing protein n=1 Tax=Mortierella hygrophila TaxID=979708 RepID=A0A9P6K0D0_9FUNG|nr:hypothetical protein EC957_004308 [Mortierella hygrophila]
MSDSTVKRVKVSKPEKKKAQPAASTTTTATITPPTPEDALIDIPAIKKKKERRVKTDADIAAKQERKRLRKETELAKSATANTKPASGPRKPTAQNKTPKWKQFLKNSSEADNAEKLKDTSYKVKGDDGSGDEDSDSDSSDDDKKKTKKRKADTQSTKDASKKSKQDDAQLPESDAAAPGLAYLVEWKKARETWKFQKLRQVWLINHMYDDKQLPDSHWSLFLEYIHDLKGAARNSAIADAKKIVEAPEDEDDEEEEKEETKKAEESEDQEMKDGSIEAEETSTIPLTEEERAAEEASKAAKVEAKRAGVVKSSRALAVLRVLA